MDKNKKSIKTLSTRLKLLSKVSHEIRTPLHGIIGLTEELEQTNLDGGQKELVQSLIKTERILMNLVNDVLDYTKLKAEGFNIRKKTALLPDILNDLRLLFGPLAKEKSVDLLVECDIRSPKVMVDVLRLKQVISNLVNNALKFTEKGAITIICRQLEAGKDNNELKYRFEVMDTGPGIPDGYESRIFKEYGQTKAGKQKRGTGLGLTISNMILKKMKSKLKLKNHICKEKGIESGACFYFDLSLEPSDQTVEEKKKELKHSFQDKKALLVDDDALMQEVTGGMLKKENIQVTVAGTIKEAKHLLQIINYDLVLVDMYLSDGHGTDLLDFCSVNEIRTGPVVIVSAFTLENENHIHLNVDAFLNKPFNRRALKRVLSSLSEK